MTVKRYFSSEFDGEMYEHKDGPYVSYKDYAALKAERDNLKNKMELINGLMDVAEQASALAKESVEKMTKERDELKGQVISLAVENSELKSYRPQPGGPAMMEALDAFFEREEYPEGGMTDAFEILCCKRVPTPATDAALANIQAQGVEKYADNLDSSADAAERDGFDEAVKFLRSEASGVRMFAAELRKGAADEQ